MLADDKGNESGTPSKIELTRPFDAGIDCSRFARAMKQYSYVIKFDILHCWIYPVKASPSISCRRHDCLIANRRILVLLRRDEHGINGNAYSVVDYSLDDVLK